MSERRESSSPIEIVAPLYNGARYLDEFLSSIRAQTHSHWRLWLRDDGSTDATPEIARRAAAADRRIVLLDGGGRRLGPAAAFDWLLARIPENAAYAMCADQDDVWLPGKITVTLDAMRAAERDGAGPVLVHTDLVVVDDRLRTIDASFWHYSGVDPEPTTLRRVVVQNVATGATVMMNRELRALAGSVPPNAVYHDWWYACVAAAFGRIIPLRTATVLYRQHDANVVGAPRGPRPRWYRVPGLARDAFARSAHLRSEIARTSRQASALLERFGARLEERDRRFLRAYAALPDRSFFLRKVDVARLRLRPEQGFWRNLGVLLRA